MLYAFLGENRFAKLCYKSWAKSFKLKAKEIFSMESDERKQGKLAGRSRMSNIVSEATNFQVAHLQEINEKFQKELSKVKEENRKLKRIIAYGSISTLSTLVDQYMEYSRVHLKKIVTEIQLSDYEEESTVEVLSLIEHLDYVKMELHKLIAVGEEGLVIHNDNLKAVVRLARELIPELEGIIRLHVDAEQSEAKN